MKRYSTSRPGSIWSIKVVVARIHLSEPSMISFSSTIIRRMLQGYKSGLSLRSLQSQADRYLKFD
eukprot:scaffold2668_cov76-Cylindrotheca_fusiformis.AAC.1